MDHMTLLDLPVLPVNRDLACCTDIILSTYITERKTIDTLEKLETFLTRWKAVFLLDQYSPIIQGLTTDRVIPLASEKVLMALKLISTKDIDFKDPDMVIALNIAIPTSLLLASYVAQKYGVGHDLAMVRLYLDPYPDLINELRSGVGTS